MEWHFLPHISFSVLRKTKGVKFCDVTLPVVFPWVFYAQNISCNQSIDRSFFEGSQ